MIDEQEILNARVLIVDDQQLFVRMLEEMLRVAGYSCVASTLDPHAVCELHRKNHYDLILLDLEMPDMDGFQVMEALKEMETDDYLSVLVITSRQDHKLRALAAGAKDFITKPFDQDELQTRIRNMLEVRLLYKKLKCSNQVLHQVARERTAELRETESLLRRNQTLMQNSMDGILVMDMHGNIVEANDAFCSMLGYTKEEVARLNVADWNAQWSANELRERFKDHIIYSTRFETIHRRKDGTLINVEISATGKKIDEQYFVFSTCHDITARKNAENIINASESKFRILFESANDCILILDPNGRIKDINHTGHARLGYTKEEMLGKRIAEFDPPEFAAKVNNRFAQIQAKGYATFESAHVRKDGSVMPIEISARFLELNGEQCVLSIVRDITERKRVETALRQHKLVIDTSIDGFWIADMQGSLLEANEAYAKLSGYTVAELTGMHISQLEAIERKPEDVQAHIAKIVAQGYDRFETCHRHKDGHEIDIEISVTHIADPQRLVIFSRDITERKQSEAMLLKSEANLRVMLDNSPYLTWLKDTEGHYVMINKVYSDQLRLEHPSQAIGKTDLDFHSKELAQKYRADDEAIMAACHNRQIEEWAFDGNKHFLVETFKAPVIDEHDNVIGTFGFARDITERKKAEEELRLESESGRKRAKELTQQFGHLLQSSFNEIYLIDADTLRFLQVSEGAKKNMGYSADELAQLTPLDLKPLYTRESYEELIAPLRTGERSSLLFETSQHRKDGTAYPVEVRLQLMQAESPMFLAVIQDITERKERMDYLKRLEESSRHLVAVQEDARRRLSGELHDRTSPNLAAIGLNLVIITNELTPEVLPYLAERLDDTRALIADTADSIREICAEMRPPLLDYAGLAAALEGYALTFMRRTGIEVQLDCTDHNIRLAQDLESSLFRIFQEALTNCVKHAQATSVRVTLNNDSRPIAMTVTDDGVGFDLEQLGKNKPIGLGLLNMREMTEVAGGRFTIESAPGCGTRIAVEIS